MSGKANVHVAPHGEGWAVTREVAEYVLSPHSELVNRIALGVVLARHAGVELVVFGREGQVLVRHHSRICLRWPASHAAPSTISKSC
ncbi:DUF2188 domain-containing protein [Cupriavidus sp. 2MCAB6]|uniref:DUF2188 domain-containing protein n=1 Tax=Cupriavidus sp. 2MCAB6 TaxID=3232981 RepID=UPI003F8E06E2